MWKNAGHVAYLLNTEIYRVKTLRSGFRTWSQSVRYHKIKSI